MDEPVIIITTHPNPIFITFRSEENSSTIVNALDSNVCKSGSDAYLPRYERSYWMFLGVPTIEASSEVPALVMSGVVLFEESHCSSSVVLEVPQP